jgi:two-component system, chemotaxis family, response regulator Rcp1
MNPASPPPALKPIELLIVEDDPGDVHLSIEAFKELDVPHRMNVVDDGVDALAYLRRQPPFQEAVRPDLILLDLNLPRKDGRAVLAEIKADPVLCVIPVVVLTTSCAEEDVLRVYQLHANCCIAKPVDWHQFIAVVKSIENFWLTVARLPCHAR